jgi:hypothetical protein
MLGPGSFNNGTSSSASSSASSASSALRTTTTSHTSYTSNHNTSTSISNDDGFIIPQPLSDEVNVNELNMVHDRTDPLKPAPFMPLPASDMVRVLG